jgi:hypothetical protein
MTAEKTCFKCGKCLPLSEFYRHSQMRDGTLNKCKSCTKHDVKQYVIDNEEKVRQRRRAYNQLPENAKRHLERGKVYIKKYQEKYKAHSLVGSAIKCGRLIPQNCEVCGTDEKVEAHHEDYSKPLDVVWLCFKHHRERHMQMKKDTE